MDGSHSCTVLILMNSRLLWGNVFLNLTLCDPSVQNQNFMSKWCRPTPDYSLGIFVLLADQSMGDLTVGVTVSLPKVPITKFVG